ncbi:MAG: tetratricopeptide repeat protein, partial [Candidatus Omnitrophica bacterium]|nr:tetratricopeptide repeat protein [Candidatus Omnitrophota bacterium]
KLNPRLLDGYLNLADTYRIRSEYDMAISYFEKAAELNPQRADTYFNLAEVYNQRGDKERASKQVIKLRELNRHDLAKILEGAVK